MDAEPNSNEVPIDVMADIEHLLAEHWQAGGTISRLPGENLNLLVQFEGGKNRC